MNTLLSDKKAVWVFMLPSLLLVIGMMYIPIGWTLGYSLFDGFPGFGSTFVGFRNYLDLWSDAVFRQSFVTTLVYTLVQVVGQVGLGLCLALLLKMGVKRHKDFMKTLIFFPSVIPAIAVAQLFIKVYEVRPQYGLLNSLLALVGRSDLIRGWLGETSTALWCLCVADIWRFMGFYAVLFYAAMIEIPEDIVEAARIDGVNARQMIRHIFLPLVFPVIITATSYCFIGTIKVFEMPYAHAVEGGEILKSRSVAAHSGFPHPGLMGGLPALKQAIQGFVAILRRAVTETFAISESLRFCFEARPGFVLPAHLAGGIQVHPQGNLSAPATVTAECCAGTVRPLARGVFPLPSGLCTAKRAEYPRSLQGAMAFFTDHRGPPQPDMTTNDC